MTRRRYTDEERAAAAERQREYDRQRSAAKREERRSLGLPSVRTQLTREQKARANDYAKTRYRLKRDSILAKMRQQRASDPERFNAYAAKHRAAQTPQQREKQRAYRRQWEIDNKKKCAERKKAYLASNRERINERRREWQAANKERIALRDSAIRAQMARNSNVAKEAIPQELIDVVKLTKQIKYEIKYQQENTNHVR